MTRLRRLLTPLVTDLRLPDEGWASRSLVVSTRTTVLPMIAGWQLVMMLSTVVSVGLAVWGLLVGYALLAAYALSALTWHRRAGASALMWVFPPAMGGLGAWGYIASGDTGSVLTFAACWQINFASCAAGLLVLSRWIVPAVIGGTMAISVMILIELPEWGSQLPGAILVTQAAIIAALRLGLPALLSLAARTDVQEQAAERARDRAEIAHRVSAQVAEESRVLHDTVINTLGAIASGGAATRDVDRVREQCAHNLAVVSGLPGATTGEDRATRCAHGCVSDPRDPHPPTRAHRHGDRPCGRALVGGDRVRCGACGRRGRPQREQALRRVPHRRHGRMR